MLTGEWRTAIDGDVVLIVEGGTRVRAAVDASPDVLSRFLTDPGDLANWSSDHDFDQLASAPDGWGVLVVARAASGEVVTMDPELYWSGI
jgi:hypothetical protein